jgi:two-component system LytT family response regulator
MLKVVAVDDEPSALSDIAARIRSDGRLKLVGTALSPREALAVIDSRAPDALFLDIQMAGMSGLDLARRHGAMKVVFVSGHSGHAVEAFELDAVDYLLKPFPQTRFQEAVARLLRARPKETRPPRPAPADDADGAIVVAVGRDRLMVPTRDIVAVLAEGDYAEIHPANGRPILAGLSLKQVEALLPRQRFLRIDRSTILNLSRLKSFRTVERVKLHLVCDGLETGLVVGRSAATALRRHLGGHGMTPTEGSGGTC